MKTRKYISLLSMLLIAALLCGLVPAAYAEETAPADESPAPLEEALPEAQPEAEQSEVAQPETEEAAAPAFSREETVLGFLRLVMKAEAERDPQVRAALCEEAKDLWNAYLETAPAGNTRYADEEQTDPTKPQRQDLLFDLMQYIMAAETETDPAARSGLYLQADAIWYSYLDLVKRAAETAKPALDPAREKALKDFLSQMAGPDMDPDQRERFLEEGGKLWDTYYGMVIDAMETNKPAPAEPQETPAPAPEAETQETPVPAAEPEPEKEKDPRVETYTFYTDNWEDFEEILQGMMEDFGPFAGVPFGFPNPWINTKWLEEAILVSGVKLAPPAEQALPEGMALQTYCAMNGTIEADYSDGKNELMLRASLIDEGFTLSGDYNNYSKAWTETFGDTVVSCLGDGKTVNVASWRSGDVAFAVTMACGLEGQGLTVEQLEAIVTGTQAAPVRDGNPLDIYADKRDIFADPIQPYTGKIDAEEPETDGDPSPASGRTGTDRKPGPNFGGSRRRGAQFDYGTFGK